MISIIIPAHREEESLNILLSHIATVQDREGAEVIIALSPESQTYTLNDFEGKVRLLCCKEQGRAVQMNEGSMLAKGEILVFLHADVKPPSTFLRDINNALSGVYDAGFFSYKFDKKNFWLSINASFTARDSIFTGGGDQCLFIRKSIFDKLGKFDQHQLLMEDFEFFKRMKQALIPYTIIKRDLIVSARKYERNSYLRVNLSNLLLVILFNLGFSSTRLKFIHDKLIHSS
jgi:rSAM/selenodomain-associated transferase 2